MLCLVLMLACISYAQCVNETLRRLPRQASFMCLGSSFSSKLLSTAMETNRENIRRSEPLRLSANVYHVKLGAFDLTNLRLYNAYTVYRYAPVQVTCIDRDIWLSIPLALHQPKVIYDLNILSNLDQGQFSLTMDRLYANVTLKIPKPPKKPGERTKLTDFQVLGSPGLRFRSETHSLVGGSIALGLNAVSRVLRYPIHHLVAYIVETTMKAYVDNTDLVF